MVWEYMAVLEPELYIRNCSDVLRELVGGFGLEKKDNISRFRHFWQTVEDEAFEEALEAGGRYEPFIFGV